MCSSMLCFWNGHFLFVCFPLPPCHLLHEANFSTACLDFVQVVLDLLQVGGTTKATQLEDELEETGNPKEASKSSYRSSGAELGFVFLSLKKATTAKHSCNARES